MRSLGTRARTEVNWTNPDEQHRVGSQSRLGFSLCLAPVASLPHTGDIGIRGPHRDVYKYLVQPSELCKQLLDLWAAASRNQEVVGRDPTMR